MSTSLKQSVVAAPIAKLVWPALELPEPHAVFGATAATNDALQKWYVGMQTAVTNHITTLSNKIDAQAAQIQTLTSGAKK